MFSKENCSWFVQKLNQYSVDSLKQRYGTARSIVHDVNKDAMLLLFFLPRCSFEHSTAIITRWVNSTIIIYSNFFSSPGVNRWLLAPIISWCVSFRLSWNHLRIICQRYHGMEIYTRNHCLCVYAYCYCHYLHTFQIQCTEVRTVSAFRWATSNCMRKRKFKWKMFQNYDNRIGMAFAMCILIKHFIQHSRSV